MIGLLLIVLGFTAKKVIPYPHECEHNTAIESTIWLEQWVKMQKLLITLGPAIASIGVLFPYLRQIGLGQLPLYMILKGGNSTFYFPVSTCIIISFLFHSP